jgi:transcriptional regulator with XRE-family HTH domain
MEWKFRINWPALVEEAKQRRKEQKLTQAKLAQIAGVSTPTLSRFESGEADIQLSSALSILNILGLVDKHTLTFPTPAEKYDSTRMVVSFNGKDGDKIIKCAISREALEDHFGDGKNPLKIFKEHHERIEHEARRKYISQQLEMDGSVLLKTNDID